MSEYNEGGLGDGGLGSDQISRTKFDPLHDLTEREESDIRRREHQVQLAHEYLKAAGMRQAQDSRVDQAAHKILADFFTSPPVAFRQLNATEANGGLNLTVRGESLTALEDIEGGDIVEHTHGGWKCATEFGDAIGMALETAKKGEQVFCACFSPKGCLIGI